jgi:hypothetical protein
MKIDEPISYLPEDVKPPPPIPCGEECEFVYWMAVDESDIEVQEAKRYTLKLMPPSIPEYEYALVANRVNSPVTRPAYNGHKLGSGVDLDKKKLPAKITDRLKERFMKPPGELMNPDRCQWPCECVRDRRREPQAVGQGEDAISVWIDFDEVIARGHARSGFEDPNKPPPVEKILDEQGNPVPFDPETDVLDLYSIWGPHGSWRTWSVIRRYRAVLVIKIKYQITKVFGICKELIEV